MTSILLIGKDGQVGWELLRTLSPLGHLRACGRDELDLAVPDSIRARIREVKPDVVVNAAAYTAVDKAESEPALAMAVNGIAPGIIADEARRLGALLVHYSTDYVFDGEKRGPYVETDTPNPVNEYGRTKLAGEVAIAAAGCAHLVFRTSWVYGSRGRNFLLTMLRLARERDELRVVADQIGAPTWSRTIAQATAETLREITGPESRDLGALSGVYHLTAGGQTSWCGFAEAIFREAGGYLPRIPRVIPIGAADYPTPARRPANSALSCSRFLTCFGIALPTWEEALSEMMQEIRTLGRD